MVNSPTLAKKIHHHHHPMFSGEICEIHHRTTPNDPPPRLELDGDLLKGALRQQVPLDARQRLVWVVVGLLYQTQLLRRFEPGQMVGWKGIERDGWSGNSLFFGDV